MHNYYYAIILLLYMTKKPKPKKIFIKIVVAIAVSLLTALLIFVGYFIYSYNNSIKADHGLLEQAKKSDSYQFHDTSDYIALIPNSKSPTGIIVYPGAFAEPEGYASVFKLLAQKNVSVFIIKSPLNFALLNVGAASKVINDNQNIKKWFVAGHSLGGVAACEFAKSHQASLSGLILLASYCNGSATKLGLPVLSISATNDGLTTTSDVENSKPKLPASTSYVVIKGGNHTQFGAFQKLQPSDGKADIGQSTQSDQIVNAIWDFIK